MHKTILEVDKLEKIFQEHNKFVAVNKISFKLKEGEILGLLGPNGAGKTTTIQMLLSTMSPTSGDINYFGKNFFTSRSEILKSVSFASAYSRLPSRLTVYENLDFYASIYGLSSNNRKEKIREILSFFDMWQYKDREAGALSAGQMTRVMLAKAFITSPKVVLLDEPTASLDPDIAQVIREFVLDQRNKFGTSILFTSHNMAEVTEVCDRVLVMQNGNIIADNTPEQLALSISSTKVTLLISESINNAINFAKQNNLEFNLHENTIFIDIDEQNIAELLINLAKANIQYSQISIDKPTLEDYFLHIVKSNKEK